MVGLGIGTEHGWTGQYERFADSLDTDAPPPVTIDDARAVIGLVLEMYDQS